MRSWEQEWRGSARRTGSTPRALHSRCLYDKNGYHGGHTASFRNDSGFIFDLVPHISFTKDTRIQELFAESVNQQFESVQINLNNYWRGHWPIHPVQLHMHGLPQEDLIVKVISDFVEASHAPERPINNYEDWLLSSFGRTFARNLSDDVRAQVPSDDGREYEHRIGWGHGSTAPASRKYCRERSRRRPRTRITHHPLTSAIPPTAGSSRI